VGAAATYALTRPPPPVVEPELAAVDPPTLMEFDAAVEVDQDAGLEVDAGTPEVDAGVEEVDAGSIDAAELKPKGKVPTVKQLKDRVAKLTALAKKKKNLDPTAMPLLGRYRTEAAATDPARRAKLDKALTEWERAFLKK
jgi:hypothetical protein